ncbi:DUF3821 domain-containing protein [Methanogenium cariaci]|uniref:DUF3821 domain-containing protein n=1 Tax=Methanogenium cariaci TaxID=2197 RepID=UPI000784900C|nr:DUF3821 domain-containing protein [Methanogenium cariaci]
MGEVIKTDTYMTFRVDSNLYQVINQRSINAEQSTDINVVVVDEEGAVFTALYADNGAVTSCPLTNLTPTTSQFYLPGVPQLDAVLNANWALDRPEYKTGVYSFYAQVNLNGAKDNVGTVTGCTKSRVYTLDVDKDDVMIETNKDVVVRKNDFSVTITGRPDKYYVLWVEGTSSVTAPDTIPSIKPNQDKVYLAGTAAGDNAALYQFRTGQAVEDDVCQNAPPATGACFAMVKLSGLGRRTVGFDTDETTRDYTYTIRADYFPPGNALAVPPVAVVANNPTSDTTRINVEKGGITIGTPGDGLYYMGEEIVLSGTNTDSDYTWLFITGPNLPSKGGSFHDIHDGVNSATDADGASVSPFYPDGQLDSLAAWRGETVGSDGTWEYRWNTKGEHLDAGTYSIYAVSTATNRDDLDTQDAIYDTAYLAIKEPFVTATASPATIAKGNDLFISGTQPVTPYRA